MNYQACVFKTKFTQDRPFTMDTLHNCHESKCGSETHIVLQTTKIQSFRQIYSKHEVNTAWKMTVCRLQILRGLQVCGINDKLISNPLNKKTFQPVISYNTHFQSHSGAETCVTETCVFCFVVQKAAGSHSSSVVVRCLICVGCDTPVINVNKPFINSPNPLRRMLVSKHPNLTRKSK